MQRAGYGRAPWAALLLLLAAPLAANGANEGTVMQLWSWWQSSSQAPKEATPAYACLAKLFSAGPRDKKVFSQYGEDGILESIYECIGTKDKYYVEFGTQDCSECTTRYLRTKGWTGLLMDGSNSNPAINLQTEFMRSDNIVELFRKYKVPHPGFDHLTVDLDLNTFWLLRSILAAGYRPRTVIAEYNRNFHPTQSYTTLDLMADVWKGTCYYDASALAYERLMRAYGYWLVAFDDAGVNLFFVKESELGAPPPPEHTFSRLTPVYQKMAWEPLHGDCDQHVWVHVDEAPGLADADYARHMEAVVLKHQAADGTNRKFSEVAFSPAISLHRHRRHPGADGGGAAGGGGGGGGSGGAVGRRVHGGA